MQDVAADFDRRAGPGNQDCGVDWLGDEVVGAGLETFPQAILICQAREHQNLDVPILFPAANLPQQIDAVEAGHHDIQQNHADIFRRQKLHHGFRLVANQDAGMIDVGGYDVPGHPQIETVIIHNQYFHGSSCCADSACCHCVPA